MAESSKRRAVLVDAVEKFKAEVAEQQAVYDRVKLEGPDSLKGHFVSKRLPAAKERLAAATKRLKAFDALPHAEMETEIERLRAACAAEVIAAKVPPLRELFVRSMFTRLELWIAIQQIETEVYEAHRRAAQLEAELMLTPYETFDRSKVYGLSPIRGITDDARRQLLGALDSLVANPDDSPLAHALDKDSRGFMTISGRDASAAIDFALGRA
jgi:hypothetical protein